jgi:hypothetical protein
MEQTIPAQGFEATEFEREPEEEPTGSSKKKGKSKKSDKKDATARKKRTRDSSVSDVVGSGEPLSHYDQMVATRKEKNAKKRKKKDVEGIDDVAIEEAVVGIIKMMEQAHDDDEAAVQARKVWMYLPSPIRNIALSDFIQFARAVL